MLERKDERIIALADREKIVEEIRARKSQVSRKFALNMKSFLKWIVRIANLVRSRSEFYVLYSVTGYVV